MSDRGLVIAALIIGGAIIAASFSTRARYSLSAADSNVAWRMDTWSGQIDICAAAYLPDGPLVRCGALVVLNPATPAPPNPNPGAADGGGPDQPSSVQPEPPSPGSERQRSRSL